MAAALTLFYRIIACGVKYIHAFDVQIEIKWLATDLFPDDFRTCFDKHFEELDANFKSE